MSNPWLHRRIFHWAHQGGAREAPTNTTFALRQALLSGCNGLEFDVHKTADDVIVVCHDKMIDRTTDRRGRIADISFVEMQGASAAFWWAPGEVARRGIDETEYLLRSRGSEDPDLRIPSLRQVLEEFPGVPLNLELKRGGYEADVVRLLRDHQVHDVLVVSFLPWVLSRFRRAGPEFPTAGHSLYSMTFWLLAHLRLAPRRSAHQAIQFRNRLGSIHLITRTFVQAAHRAGLAVHVWTVDDPADMDRLARVGVDGIMTDRPSVLTAVLTIRDARWKP